MVYTPTQWKESTMTTQNKVDGLNYCETQYDEACSYLDSLTHSALYYTKGDCSKFFSAATDGTGSGLIAATLDGFTAQQIIDSGTPSGCIGIWASSEASIPAGYFLCNGSNSTPNLRDRFPIPAGGAYSRGQTGGAASVTPTASAVTIATHALTVSKIPGHTHGYTDTYRNSVWSATGENYYQLTQDNGPYYTDAASSTAHGHSGSTFSGSSLDIRPKFMALCYIMRS